MKSLQETPINPCLFGDHSELDCFGQGFLSLEDKMPFLEMLQSVETPQFLAFKEPNFQSVLNLSLQHLNNNNNNSSSNTQIHQALDQLESCVTREVLDFHSPVKSESTDHHHHHQVVDLPKSEDDCTRQEGDSGFVKRSERRKRKRSRPAKNKEEVESQRMTHIAVERNRRRQMNDHLNSLRSLMPSSYIQRGDQASIIGGAIDFVKELEQLLQSMEAEKRMRRIEETTTTNNNNSSSDDSSLLLKSAAQLESEISQAESSKLGGEAAAEIEVNVIHNHVNLKIQCERRAGQLLQGIVTLESLRLTVLHLNITSSQASVLYSFNLKMEDDCQLRSADEISATVHQIFR